MQNMSGKTCQKDHKLLLCSMKKPSVPLDSQYLFGVKIHACLSQSLCNTAGWTLRFFPNPASLPSWLSRAFKTNIRVYCLAKTFYCEDRVLWQLVL
jgi:hypothetical protein